MKLPTSKSSNLGIPYEAYTFEETSTGGPFDVGYFPDGSGVLLRDNQGNEVAVDPRDINTLRSLLRYCQSRCEAILKEEDKWKT